MISSPDALVPCPSCQGLNAPDSKFCRHCGHSLDAQGTAAPVASLADELEFPNEMLPAIAVPENTSASQEALSSPGEIDGRRARQLLERAHGLSERGDAAGAILACRQAIALVPTIENGQAMLGALLERSGDMTHALQAFEKAAQIAPESSAKRDMERLREKMGAKPDTPIFHFDDAELFDDEILPSIASDETASAVPEAAAMTPQAAEVSDSSAAPAVAGAVALGTASEFGEKNEAEVFSGDGEHAAGEIDAAPATSEVVPSHSEVSDVRGIAAALPPTRPATAAPSNVPPSTPIGSRVVAPSAFASAAGTIPGPVINPVSFGDTDSSPQGWSALWARPSYFTRSLPLIGATILSLGFLGWARGAANERNLASTPSTVVARAETPELIASGAVPQTSTAGNPQGSNLPPLAPVGSAAVSNGGFPISNQPAGNVASPPATAQNTAPGAQNSRPATASPRPATAPASGNTVRNAQRNAARSPQLLAPAPIPAPRSSRPANPSPRGGGSSDFTLPAPIISSPAPAAPATSVLPSGGTPALNPAGASGRGYVRITGGRFGSQLPSRPQGRAGDAERAAAAATRTGSTTQAIDGLTNAINANSSDAGFRFQQRATLFLGQGDYSRAADDFQSAISAYNDQIARGDQAASARAGLRASRSGLNVALAGGR